MDSGAIVLLLIWDQEILDRIKISGARRYTLGLCILSKQG